MKPTKKCLAAGSSTGSGSHHSTATALEPAKKRRVDSRTSMPASWSLPSTAERTSTGGVVSQHTAQTNGMSSGDTHTTDYTKHVGLTIKSRREHAGVKRHNETFDKKEDDATHKMLLLMFKNHFMKNVDLQTLQDQSNSGDDHLADGRHLNVYLDP